MTHVIINFRRHLKRRNFSPHTVKYYLNIIKQYVIWLDVPLEQATSEKIDDVIVVTTDKGTIELHLPMGMTGDQLKRWLAKHSDIDKKWSKK